MSAAIPPSGANHHIDRSYSIGYQFDNSNLNLKKAQKIVNRNQAEIAEKNSLFTIVKNIAWAITIVGPIMSLFKQEPDNKKIFKNRIIKQVQAAVGDLQNKDINFLKTILQKQKVATHIQINNNVASLVQITNQHNHIINLKPLPANPTREEVESYVADAIHQLNEWKFPQPALPSLKVNGGDKAAGGVARNPLVITPPAQKITPPWLKKEAAAAVPDKEFEEDLKKFEQMKTEITDALSLVQKEFEKMDKSLAAEDLIKDYEDLEVGDHLVPLAKNALTALSDRNRVHDEGVNKIKSLWVTTMDSKTVIERTTDLESLTIKMAETIRKREVATLHVLEEIEGLYENLVVDLGAEDFGKVLNERIEKARNLNPERPYESLRALSNILRKLPARHRALDSFQRLEEKVEVTELFFKQQEKLIQAENEFSKWIDQISEADTKLVQAKSAFESAYERSKRIEV